MPNLRLDVSAVSFPLRTAFSISRGSKTCAETVQVTVSDGDIRARGESTPYARYGETVDSVIAGIEAVRAQIESGLTRHALQDAMPAGAARAAIDAALWDLEAKSAGEPVWALAGLPEPEPAETAYTIVLDTPDAMAEAARQAPGTILKLKLGGPEDLLRVEAVHAARPDAKLVLDGNEGLEPEAFPKIAARASKLGVVLIEQPFREGRDSALIRRAVPIAICADESAHTAADIETLARAYDVVNIKLDKTGGLTEAIRMTREARRAGMGVMVGCMVSSSLSMAPAMMLSGLADLIDLDGPLWLDADIEDGLAYEGARVSPPSPALWG
ncbi:MAG: N-acetyl-D-Glu racemase DgcA [Pseudomonadota bacterium]